MVSHVIHGHRICFILAIRRDSRVILQFDAVCKVLLVRKRVEELEARAVAIGSLYIGNNLNYIARDDAEFLQLW